MNEPDDQQQDQRSDRSVDDRQDNTRAEMKAELGKEPIANERARDSYEEVAYDSEASALHDLSGQPSGNEAN